jgi:hypothetical protein
MSLHLFRRMAEGGLFVIMAMLSCMYSFTSHPHAGTDLKHRNVSLIN